MGQRASATYPTHPSPERAVLVGVETKVTANSWPIDASLEELAMLTHTAGGRVVGTVVQRRQRPTPALYLGKGKVEELIDLKARAGYDVAIFDDELSPTQQRNLEDALEVKIIDRTALILDIFSQRARTHEGRLQVELAQHEYLLPRLAGQWSHLERLGGGIGTRGPGETQIETDRRLVRNKINRLHKETERVRKHRALYRRQRTLKGIPVVALVGYTNSGKSTLLNALSNAGVFVEDKLFATLDPTTKRISLPDGKRFLLTDTVGFIQKLPTMLVAAFRATLEELEEANLLLHVIDITHPNAAEQSETVQKTLYRLKLGGKPAIAVLNKMDAVVPSEAEMLDFAVSSVLKYQDGILISAAKGWGLGTMMERIEKIIFRSDSHNIGYVAL